MPDSFEHNGHTVTLTSDFRFTVSGDATEENRSPFSSADEARIYIDNRVKARERQQNAREKLAIDAIDDLGNPCVIRGINSNTSALLGAPVNDRRREVGDIYPPVSWITIELKRLLDLTKEVSDLKRKLSKYALNGKRGYGRIDASKYDDKIAEFQKEFARKHAAALAAAPAPSGEGSAL